MSIVASNWVHIKQSRKRYSYKAPGTAQNKNHHHYYISSSTRVHSERCDSLPWWQTRFYFLSGAPYDFCPKKKKLSPNRGRSGRAVSPNPGVHSWQPVMKNLTCSRNEFNFPAKWGSPTKFKICPTNLICLTTFETAGRKINSEIQHETNIFSLSRCAGCRHRSLRRVAPSSSLCNKV